MTFDTYQAKAGVESPRHVSFEQPLSVNPVKILYSVVPISLATVVAVAWYTSTDQKAEAALTISQHEIVCAADGNGNIDVFRTQGGQQIVPTFLEVSENRLPNAPANAVGSCQIEGTFIGHVVPSGAERIYFNQPQVQLELVGS